MENEKQIKRRKRVSMSDVAKDAGVSVTTVSHVINRTAKISRETAKRVNESVIRLAYEPLPGSSFKRGQRLIAVFIPDLGNEFYAKSVQSIFNTAWRSRYGIVVCDLQHTLQAESNYLKNFIQQGVSGVIFFGGTANIEMQILQTSKVIPVVLGDMHIPDGLRSRVDAVCTDNELVMEQIVTRFVKAGYRKFGYISEDFLLANTKDRFNGYKLGLAQNGIEFNKTWLWVSQSLRLNKTVSAYTFFSKILSQKQPLPEIIFCTSDLIAIGVMSAMKQHDINVPKDIGVVGFDNISLSEYCEPRLTTVAQNMEKIGSICCSLLLERIAQPNLPTREETVKAKLVLRDSVRM